jgi:hypothetical protein
VQEATEVTLKTEVEAGATGYSVTGGGDQGIFVKQVLKDSPADTLFSLREGATAYPSLGSLSSTLGWGDIEEPGRGLGLTWSSGWPLTSWLDH